MRRPPREAFVKSLALSLILFSCASAQETEPQSPSPWIEGALQAARWIQSCERSHPAGLVWDAVPGSRRPGDTTGESGETPSFDRSLYSGTPGVILFHLELFLATGEQWWLESAALGAGPLLVEVQRDDWPDGHGLYRGLAGAGFVLEHVYQGTGSPRFREGCLRCLERIHEDAIASEHGASWSQVNDVISGAAGTGLFLLWTAKWMDRPQDLELAARAGRHLIALGEPAKGGLDWPMDPDFPRRMPNFSHGTAGIAFFLARLYEETDEPAFLEAALAGARHLLAIRDPGDPGCRIHHHTPGGEDLYYLGWCHGPTGTARLFHQLAKVSGKGEWNAWALRGAESIRVSGIPEVRTPGFWNNVGQCCGTAGVAELLLDLSGRSDGAPHLEFARRLGHDLIRRGELVELSSTRNGERQLGRRWVQAEHRVRPELLQAQSGYMQGAAGIGMLLLHLHAREPGVEGRGRIRLPDDPFGSGW